MLFLWLLIVAVSTYAAPTTTDAPHPLSPLSNVLVISGSRNSTRVDSLKRKFANLDGHHPYHPQLQIIDGVNGGALELLNDDRQQLYFGDTASGLAVRLWDWREGRGVGGPGMDTATVARIAACAMSHIIACAMALQEALLSPTNHHPVLILEDDVSFAPLLREAGGRVAVRDAIQGAEHLAALEGAIVGIIQIGYLLPSPRLAITGAINNASSSSSSSSSLPSVSPEARYAVRRRRACDGDERRVVGIQAYLLTAAGARAVLDAYFRPGGAEGALRWLEGSGRGRRGGRSGGGYDATIDLRPAVNFAADYMLFSAIEAAQQRSPAAAAAVRSYLSWRPWIVEDEALSAASSLFPGTVKQSTADTLRLAELLLDGRLPPPRAPPLSRPHPSLETPAASTPRRSRGGRSKVADFILVGDNLVDISSGAATAEEMLRVLRGENNHSSSHDIQGDAEPDGIFGAAIAQCVDICGEDDAVGSDGGGGGDDSTDLTILMPSAMQCWRAAVARTTSTFGDLDVCAASGLDTDKGACEMLLRAAAEARRRRLRPPLARLNSINDYGHEEEEAEKPDPFAVIAETVRSLKVAEGPLSRHTALRRLEAAYGNLGDGSTVSGLRQIIAEKGATRSKAQQHQLHHVPLASSSSPSSLGRQCDGGSAGVRDANVLRLTGIRKKQQKNRPETGTGAVGFA